VERVARHFSTQNPEFQNQFRDFLASKRAVEADVDDRVAAIIKDVRRQGDAAVVSLTRRFDELAITPGAVSLTTEQINSYAEDTPSDARHALELAAERIRAFHERQLPQNALWQDSVGMALGWRWSAMESAGLYAPGGLASYPSSVLMNAIPAHIAGVKRLALCVPMPRGAVNPLVFYAARLAGIDEIAPIGGAQAIAAMAYGTESIAPVDVIVGPGNAYVAAAKKQVASHVKIDSIAGPSEVLIIADGANNPKWLALDLLAQAEHDKAAQAILASADAALLEAVRREVDVRLSSLPRAKIAGASWRDFGATILTKDLEEAATIANRIAPEHLQLCTAEPLALSEKIMHAGAIFLGAATPEAIGDYIAGSNHVLPTTGAARRSSGLSVFDFMKRTTLCHASPAALDAIGPAAATLARHEGLDAHRLSIEIRLADADNRA
jgi:histidinol dehydrogenase